MNVMYSVAETDGGKGDGASFVGLMMAYIFTHHDEFFECVYVNDLMC